MMHRSVRTATALEAGILPILAFFIFVLAGCGTASVDEPKAIKLPGHPTGEGARRDDAEINDAMAKARDQFDHFASMIDHATTGDKAAVKIRVATPAGNEYMWVTRISRASDGFKGVLEEDAFNVPSMKKGNKVTLKKPEVADWVFEHDGHIEGDFTQPIFDRREAKAK